MKNKYEVLIIGGGPGGLSAALTLARGGRSVAIFDHKDPRNAPAEHMQNFPSRDGTPPMEFRRLVEAELVSYGVTIHRLKVDELKKIDDHFHVKANGSEYSGKKIVLAHGVKDILPDLPGIKEVWGKSVFLCPYCHGYEQRGKAIGMMGPEAYAHHMLPLLLGHSRDLIWFSNGEVIQDKAPLEKLGVKLYESPVIKLHHEGIHLRAIELADGSVIGRDILFSRFAQKLSVELGTNLGCEVNEQGYYVVNENYKTTVDGVYAVGDAVQMRQSVLLATSTGQIAGATINYEILADLFHY